jgi:hypothetical protein
MNLTRAYNALINALKFQEFEVSHKFHGASDYRRYRRSRGFAAPHEHGHGGHGGRKADGGFGVSELGEAAEEYRLRS